MDWTAIGTLAGVVFAVLSAMGAFIYSLGKHSERLTQQEKALAITQATAGKIFDELRIITAEIATRPCQAHAEHLKAIDDRLAALEAHRKP